MSFEEDIRREVKNIPTSKEKKMDNVPRRARIDLMTPVEL